MFWQIASTVGATALFNSHPQILMTRLEDAWARRLDNAAFDLGDPRRRSNLAAANAPWNLRVAAQGNVIWDHLIYAYMVENTRIYEIMRRVVREFLHGEKIGTPSAASQLWLRNTEELFYRHAPSFSITTIDSHIRPDLRSTRLTAYGRMFGMNLNHGTEDGKPYPFIQADAANTEFVTTLEDLLREVWIGIVHLPTTSGPNPTDREKIANLCRKLRDMLLSRRQNGNLSREEFTFVSMMSWFHLTVAFNSSVVVDLRADASGIDQRLFKIAERVGLPAHGFSRSYFEIARPLSLLLILIELGTFNNPLTVPALFSGGLRTLLETIITHYSIISGKNLKARPVAPA